MDLEWNQSYSGHIGEHPRMPFEIIDPGYGYGALLCICKEDGSNTGGVSKKSRNSDKEASWIERKIKKYSRNEKYIISMKDII